MSKRLPVDQARYIESEYRKYLKSTFTLDDNNFNQKFNDEIEKVELYKGPFLNKILPFKSGKSLEELSFDNIVSPKFEKLLSPDIFKRPLYLHQEEAIKKIEDNRSIVVTTGTGSGKTESYLFPIINSILKEDNIDQPGVRAILLFPMNALVNDQMKRIRDILRKYPSIKFGRYVGDTVDDVNPISEKKRLKSMFNQDIPDNELVTREQIRQNPPHLLFTNYSMLEYLLLRPNDCCLLEGSDNNWRFIVIDEAHSYAGALGIEFGMLMRRLIQTIKHTPQFILTSATLGEKGESEDQIIDFAHNLTSAVFTRDDVIFSNRKPLLNEQSMELLPEEYSIIRESFEDITTLKSISSKYNISVDSSNYYELLYKLLKNDRNVLFLSTLLNQPKEFNKVFETFNNAKNLTEKQLTDMIYIISSVYSNYRELFDIKYHSFIRTISGCFVTLDNEHELRLENCLNIGEYAAFEIGKCKKCEQPYIIGTIVNNKLYQSNDVDIYENVDETYKANINYFIFGKDINDIDSFEVQEYKLCVKCREINAVGDTNPITCSCGEENIITIYKVKEDVDDEKTSSNVQYKNNITYCPCCQKSSNTGIVSSFYLGKDAATAIITQIMLEALDDQEENKENVQVEGLNPFEVGYVDESTATFNTDKQLLEFSDGRQQASFAATFCEYNHERFLRKKMLYDLSVKYDEPLTIDDIIEKLEENKECFANEKYKDDSGKKNAWITVLNELLNIDGNNGAEGLGLFAFDLNMDKIEKNSQYLKGFYSKNGINLKCNENTICSILNYIAYLFRSIPAIKYDNSSLEYTEKRDAFSYRMFDNYAVLEKSNGSKFILDKKDITNRVRSILPVNKNNKLTNYLSKVLKLEDDKIKEFIRKSVVLLENMHYFEIKNGQFYQIPAEKYILKGKKLITWYRCNKCKTITRFNCNSICPTCFNDTLEVCNPDDVLSSNYYRNKYMNKKLERIVFKEHTAQLSSSQGLQYQNDFIKKNINVLSCSTTFEMGVDIGSLETVFMRNVPPTPANYVQRAGRAGRGKNSSAFVLTFCGNSSHDYTYFQNPIKMISGNITPPKFDISNEKIVLRHINDASLGYFLKKCKADDFRSIGNFVSDYEYYKKVMLNKPSELNDYINDFIKDTKLSNYNNFGWINYSFAPNSAFEEYISKFRSDIDEFERLAEKYSKTGETLLVSRFKNEIERLKSDRFVDSLANANVIPKYGFPVDTVNLKTNLSDSNVDLSRDLKIAISEYAPGSEVVADGNKYKSQYIIIPKKGITREYYCACKKCNRYNFGIDKNELTACKYCGNILDQMQIRTYIVPKYGFYADSQKSKSRTIKPKKTYSNEVQYVGDGNLIGDLKYPSMDNEKVELIQNSNDELLVLNESNFYVCLECGYSELKEGEMLPPILHKEHKTRYDNCLNKNLEKISLGYKFKTDVVKIRFEKNYEKKHLMSFLYAFLDGMSIALSISRNDINGTVYTDTDGHGAIIIYDDVPGGAGHSKRLLDGNNFKKVIDEAYDKVKQCTCDINTSCYNCLRNYKNQNMHIFLTRKAAIDVLKDLI